MGHVTGRKSKGWTIQIENHGEWLCPDKLMDLSKAESPPRGKKYQFRIVLQAKKKPVLKRVVNHQFPKWVKRQLINRKTGLPGHIVLVKDDGLVVRLAYREKTYRVYCPKTLVQSDWNDALLNQTLRFTFYRSNESYITVREVLNDAIALRKT